MIKTNKKSEGNKQMKMIYIVNGSEDGLQGAFGNIKGAYKEALNYINACDEHSKIVSYSKVCMKLRDTVGRNIKVGNAYCGSCCYATITAFVLNQPSY